MQVSNRRYLEKVFRNLRQKLHLTEDMIGIEANNLLIWGLFMATTMKAAVHLGPNYTENMEVSKNANFKEIQNLFNVIQRLIMDHPMEILNVSTVVST